METKKIAMACFLGGSICVAIALILTPSFWWLGMIAGFAVGYLAYDFREVLIVFPKAFKTTNNWIIEFWKKADDMVIAWFNESHPFYYPSALISLGFIFWIVIGERSLLSSPNHSTILLSIMIMALLIEVFVLISFLFCLPMIILAFFGARYSENCYWRPFLTIEEKYEEREIKRLMDEGLIEKPITYTNVLRWEIKGIIVILHFFTWTLWKYLLIGIFHVAKFLILSFFWQLFKEIHSEKRVHCGFYATIGGTLSYLLFSSGVTLLASKIVLIFFGGILGAFYGVVIWELVSKRLLKIES